jgi:AcrR family transcriptional regulator
VLFDYSQLNEAVSHRGRSTPAVSSPARPGTGVTGNEPAVRPRRTRRDEYAEQTRTAVVEAARGLFAQRGYFATTVNEIADASRVSAGTVYQQCGGKQGLLRTLMDIWTTSALVQETLDLVDGARTLDEVLEILADSYLEFYRQFDDIIQVIVATAPHDVEASKLLAQAGVRHRTALQEIARKVHTLGTFPASFSDDDFADITMYHYGPQNGFHFTVAQLGWSEQRARDWINHQFTRSLLEATCDGRSSVASHAAGLDD